MSEPTLPPATILGRYELITRLATGGMAELFLARERGQAGMERIVVVKRILPHLANDPAFVEMFKREARLVAGLSHPNVVQIYNFDQEDGLWYLAMEYIHGSTLREVQLLASQCETEFPLDVSLSVIEQACRGLHAAHELRDLEGRSMGLVHRDVSPHNLMCTSEGHVKLLDFGIAKTADGREATYSGNLKGKFAYLSPEQCMHQALDRRSDVFALGIVAWELVTGQRLFKRRTELEMMQAVMGGDVPLPSSHNPALPGSVEAVILKALAVEREERHASAEAMRKALVAAVQDTDLTLSEDRVARFLTTVAGDRLAERRASLQSAVERSLTAQERNRLLHMTGSNSRSESVSVEDRVATVVQRPHGKDAELQGDHDATVQVPREFQAKLAAIDHDASVSRTKQTGRPSDLGHDELPIKRGLRWRLVGAGFVGVVALALVLFVAFWPRAIPEDAPMRPDAVVVSGDPLPLGWAPTIDPEILIEEVGPLHEYLERTTGRPVPLRLATDYGELSQWLRSGEVSFAALPPLLYVRTQRVAPDISLLAFKEFDGAVSSDALLLVPSKARIRGLADLEGKTFCFVDPHSTSGYFLPRAYLQRHGFDPDTFVGKIHWSGDHLQAMRDLSEGKCEATATYSGAFLSADEFGIRVGQIRTLAITGHIPQDAMVAGPNVAGEDVEMIREALLNFSPRDALGLERLGDNQRITGFAPGADADFDLLREAVLDEVVDMPTE